VKNDRGDLGVGGGKKLVREGCRLRQGALQKRTNAGIEGLRGGVRTRAGGKKGGGSRTKVFFRLV